MSIPTPKRAWEAVEVMFDAMEDYYRELQEETSQFFKNVVKLPADGTMDVLVYGGLQFHCLHFKGKRMIIPEKYVPELKNTSVKKVLRKRYALHVICSDRNDRIRVAGSSTIEVLPSIAHGWTVPIKNAEPLKIPGICSGKPRINVKNGYVFLHSVDDIVERPIFRIARIPKKNGRGAGEYKIEQKPDSVRGALLRGTTVNFPPDLRTIYKSELWAEKLRDVLDEMKEEGLL